MLLRDSFVHEINVVIIIIIIMWFKNSLLQLIYYHMGSTCISVNSQEITWLVLAIKQTWHQTKLTLGLDVVLSYSIYTKQSAACVTWQATKKLQVVTRSYVVFLLHSHCYRLVVVTKHSSSFVWNLLILRVELSHTDFPEICLMSTTDAQ